MDTGASTVLEKGKKYFLFPNGPEHYYVSKLPKESSNHGCFHKSLFKLVREDEWPPEPAADSIPELDSSKVYKARLIWRKRGYEQIQLGTYYLHPAGTHAYVYRDKQLKKCVGCFPVHWFEGFKEIVTDESETNEPIFETNGMIDETEVPERETKEETYETFEQMSIFDFV
jgi:hypothetical protein